MYLNENGEVRKGASMDGHLSVAVPGTVAGLFEVHTRHGKLPWKDVVAPPKSIVCRQCNTQQYKDAYQNMLTLVALSASNMVCYSTGAHYLIIA